MATRATYQINSTFFYCHWDGYQSGAAHRFALMLDALTRPETGARCSIDAIEDRRGGLEYAFIRGNLDAEPTESHEIHGDTEYRYTVKLEADGRTIIEVAARNRNGDWKSTERCDLAEWINRHREPEWGTPVAVRVQTECRYNGTRHTYATAANALAVCQNYQRQAEGYAEGNPNKETAQERADFWAAAIDPEPEANS